MNVSANRTRENSCVPRGSQITWNTGDDMIRRMRALPPRLEYLQPVIAEMSKLGLDDFHEDLDTTALVAALRKRVKGLAMKRAKEMLTKDREALETWVGEREEL